MTDRGGEIPKIPDNADPALPDGAVETARMIVVAYIDKDGQSRYSLHARGESHMTTYLGLLVMAQQEVMDWGRGRS